jgi:hypothetical protein
MANKKPYIISGVLIFIAVIMFVTAIVLPIVLTKEMKKEVKTSIELHESEHNIWGKIPGDMEAIVLHEYHMFNLVNPDDVLFNGAIPVVTDMAGYIYQEYDNYIERSYEKKYGTDKAVLLMWPFSWMDKSSHCKWHNSTSPNDQVTSINLGVFGAWDTLKHTPPESLSVTVLYLLALGFNGDLPLASYSQGLHTFIASSYTLAKLTCFNDAGLTKDQSTAVYYDSRLGWQNWTTFQVWVQAYEQNLVNSTFTYPSSPSQALRLLYSKFGFSGDTFTAIFNGSFATAYNMILSQFASTFKCSSDPCDPIYIGGLQWARSGITNSIFNNPKSLTTADSNSTVYGYPEMSYFMNATGLSSKYPNVTWTTDDYVSLFNYDYATGWPSGSAFTLLDIGHLRTFFALGRAYQFEQIQIAFNLTSPDHAKVLWDYVNAAVALTGLQNCTDEAVYNIDNRGITTEASLGTVGSQALYGLYVQLAESLPAQLTSTYDFARFTFELNLTCAEVVGDTLPSAVPVCSNPELAWSPSTLASWLLAYWEGIGTDFWNQFSALSGLTDSDMLSLFDASGTLAKNFTMLDGELLTYYNCSSLTGRCFSYDLADMQWGASNVTMNLPTTLANLGLVNATSVMTVFGGWPLAPEYAAYAAQRRAPLLNNTQVRHLLSFDYLLGGSPLQRYFIWDFAKNKTAMASAFMLDDVDTMTNYVRFAVDKSAFGGMFKTMTVEEWLWTNVDSFVEGLQNTNPLLGGDPSLDPTSVRLGGNQTREQWELVPKELQSWMDTGRHDIDKVRWWRKLNGVDYISIVKPVFNGYDQWGPIIEYIAYNPWAEEVEVQGGDSWNFQVDVDSDSDIVIYLDEAARFGSMTYDHTTTIHGFKCYRYRIGPDLLSNATDNPDFAKYYQFAPSGLANATTVMGAPMFVSKPYFYSGDKMLNTLVNYTETDLNTPDKYDSYIDIEHYSGGTFYVSELLQFNAELKPDALYPNLGLFTLQNTGYKTYMPVFYVEKSQTYSDSIIDEYYGSIKDVELINLLAQIIGFSIGSICILLWLGYMLRLYINKRRVRLGLVDESPDGPLIEPIMLSE